MNYKDVSNKLRSIANKSHAVLADKVIIKKGDRYQAFGEYHIRECAGFWEITTTTSDHKHRLNLGKSALAWCIAHKVQNFDLARSILHLDNRLAAKQADIDLITGRLKQGIQDPELRFVLQCRLSEDIYNRQTYKKQLSKCLEMAKYIKIKGSSHELNRLN